MNSYFHLKNLIPLIIRSVLNGIPHNYGKKNLDISYNKFLQVVICVYNKIFFWNYFLLLLFLLPFLIYKLFKYNFLEDIIIIIIIDNINFLYFIKKIKKTMISLPLNIIIDPTLKIFILLLSGCYLAKMGILDDKNVKIVSKMIEYLFIPYLMFTYFL